ncbi:MAG TPA: DUF502 domain-containing protein [Burkholderiales bacterium]|nr:DUF502 domain-containing protein [Burkholderiales bacterium]
MKRAWKGIGGIFLAGLLTLLPVVATIYFLVWLVGLVDALFGEPLRWLLPEGYHTGMGILVALAIVFGVGVLMQAYLFRRVFRGIERLLLEVPLVRSIYAALRDLIGLFSKDTGPALQVVEVTLPGTNWRLLGFVTRTEFNDLPEGLGRQGDIAVYLPMSYQIGGYTIFLPQKQVRPVDMSREDALKFILTAGLKARPDQASGRKPR